MPHDKFVGRSLRVKTLIIGTDVLTISRLNDNDNKAELCAKKTIWLSKKPPTGYNLVSSDINYVSKDAFKLSNQKIYPFLNLRFTVDGLIYVPVKPSERICDVIDGSYDPSITNIVITNKVTYRGIEMTVGNINKYSFYRNTYITSVQLSNIEKISDYVFAYCDNLSSVILAEGLLSIGRGAFLASGLESIVIPDTVTSLGVSAFFKCHSLVSVSIGKGVPALNYNTFAKCSSLSEITIPANVSLVDNYVFKDCFELTNVNIADRQTELTLGVNEQTLQFENEFNFSPLFADCRLEKVYIGGKISYTTESSKVFSPFYRNMTLRSVKIADKVTEITPKEFYGCTNLHEVVMGDDVESIGSSAFEGCTSLRSFTFGPKIQVIGYGAFAASGLESIDIPDTVTELGACAFDKCTALASVSIGKGVRALNYSTFAKCSSLSEVTIPSNVGLVGNCVFADCVNLTKVIIEDRTLELELRNDFSPLFASCPLDEVYIGGDISYPTGSYKDSPFYRNTSLQSVKITGKATKINPNEFYGCINLENVVIGSGVGIIGQSAFNGCTSLESIIIPNSVTALGEHAFADCSALNSVSIGKGIPMLNEHTFSGCSSLPEITIPANVTSVGDYVFDGCSSLAKVNIADRDALLSLGSNDSSPLFASCPLDEVYIGGDISYPTESSKGYSPFYRNTSLRSVKITDKETEISPNEFYGCTNLQEVVIGDGVETIGNYAFSGCSSLKSFAFGSKVQTIGEEAFSDCTAMTSLTSHNPVPPTCGTQALDDINKWDCTLYVPKASIDTYKAAPQWKEFFFYGEAPLGIDDINGELPGGIEIETVGGNALRIGGADGCFVEVYGVDGRCEWRTDGYDGSAVELAPGVHIVRVGGRSTKVML